MSRRTCNLTVRPEFYNNFVEPAHRAAELIAIAAKLMAAERIAAELMAAERITVNTPVITPLTTSDYLADLFKRYTWPRGEVKRAQRTGSTVPPSITVNTPVRTSLTTSVYLADLLKRVEFHRDPHEACGPKIPALVFAVLYEVPPLQTARQVWNNIAAANKAAQHRHLARDKRQSRRLQKRPPHSRSSNQPRALRR
jgi:hypothetical protein